MAQPATSTFPSSAYFLRRTEGATQSSTLFQPPLSPTDFTSRPWNGQAHADLRGSAPSRKRSRGSPSSLSASTPNLKKQDECYFSTPYNTLRPVDRHDSTFESADQSGLRSATSPSPFVNDRYNLAGGFDTPTGLEEARQDSEWLSNEHQYRRQWDLTSSGVSHSASPPGGNNSQSWGQFMFGIINGSLSIAGRVIQFAKKGAFQGFHAGGGQGLLLDSQHQNQLYDKMEQSTYTDPDGDVSPPTPFQIVPSPLPGRYPVQDEQLERAAKRKKGDGSGWVMVEQPSPQAETTSQLGMSRVSSAMSNYSSKRQSMIPRPSASRASSRHSLAPTMIARRHNSTATHAGSPTSFSSGRPASTASPRSTHIPTSPMKSNANRINTSSRPSTANGHYRRDSGDINLSPDAAQYQARIAREERRQDASMRKMNAKLKDMIREGQAALGARVEIEDSLDPSNSDYFSTRW